MIKQLMGGDIVYVSSKNSIFAGPNNVAYGATKADQTHQVRLLAAELGEHQIRVNGVNPDGVEESELGEYYAQRTLLKQAVLPEHIVGDLRAYWWRFVTHDGHPYPRRQRRRISILALNNGRIRSR